MAAESHGDYVLAQLRERLPDGEGQPMFTKLERDFSIVSDKRFFHAVAESVVDAPEPIPGLEPYIPARPRLARQQAKLAIARRGKGNLYAESLMLATYGQDTCRSLYRVAAQGEGAFIPVDEDDTPDSLYARVGDYVANIFEAADDERIPLSAFRREQGTAELTERFEDRDKKTVQALSVLAGWNKVRQMSFWLNQLVVTTKGFDHLRSETKEALLLYAAGRPSEYIDRPNLLQIIADNSGREPKKAS